MPLTLKKILLKLNKASLILKNNPTSNFEISFFLEHLLSAYGALLVSGAMFGKHWGPNIFLFTSYIPYASASSYISTKRSNIPTGSTTIEFDRGPAYNIVVWFPAGVTSVTIKKKNICFLRARLKSSNYEISRHPTKKTSEWSKVK